MPKIITTWITCPSCRCRNKHDFLALEADGNINRLVEAAYAVCDASSRETLTSTNLIPELREALIASVNGAKEEPHV